MTWVPFTAVPVTDSNGRVRWIVGRQAGGATEWLIGPGGKPRTWDTQDEAQARAHACTMLMAPTPDRLQ